MGQRPLCKRARGPCTQRTTHREEGKHLCGNRLPVGERLRHRDARAEAVEVGGVHVLWQLVAQRCRRGPTGCTSLSGAPCPTKASLAVQMHVPALPVFARRLYSSWPLWMRRSSFLSLRRSRYLTPRADAMSRLKMGSSCRCIRSPANSRVDNRD